MELRHLRYFTAVVQWKSYREASRRIHVAQPAISQTVIDLDVLSPNLNLLVNRADLERSVLGCGLALPQYDCFDKRLEAL